MTDKEKEFIESIRRKIKKYNIKTTVKNAVSQGSNQFIETEYNDGTTEIVDPYIERYLCTISPYYFIERYAWIDFPGVGVIPFNLYYFQEEVLKEINDLKKMVFLKTRQCFPEDTFVTTDKGYISIKNVKKGDLVETLVDNKPVFTEVVDSFYQGKKQIMRILTNFGSEIKCTLDHRIYTNRGWVEAKDLTLDDEIVSLFDKGFFGNFKLDDDKLAAFIGYYLADGKHNQPYFINTNINYINEVIEAGNLFENCNPYIYKRPIINNHKQAYEARLVSKSKSSKLYRPLKEFMNRFGLNVKSKNRGLTNELLNLNKKQMSILLNRLYAGDGWITYKKDSRRKNYIQYEIGLGSPNYTLIKQIEYILQTKYGIQCYVYEDKKYNNRFWKLRINQKKAVIKFINEIGIKGKTDKKDIINLISKENPYQTRQSFEKIRKIEKVEGVHDVYDITTGTSDFLANGLLVHNCGISTVFSLYCFWRGNFKEAESIDVVSIKQSKARAFVAKMDATIKRMPEFLKTPITNKNTEVIKWNNGSQILSESASPKAGRGDSLSLLIMDEAAFYQSDSLARGIVSAAQPTLTRTGGTQVIISTPQGTAGPGSYYYEQVTQLQVNGNTKENKLVEIDWYEVPDMPNIFPQKGYNDILNKFIKRKYFTNPAVRAEMKKYFQPITDNWIENPWLKKQYEDLGKILFLQEIIHSFVVNGDQVFEEEVLERMKNSIVDPVIEDRLGDKKVMGLWTWKSPVPKHRYILGCLPPGEKVLTDSGLKSIEDVNFNDSLINKDGNLVKIKNIQEYNNVDEEIYKIKLEGILRRTTFTGEHPLMASTNTKLVRKHGGKRYWDFDFKFTNVKNLNVDDWVIYPNVYKNNILSEADMLKHWNTNSGRKDFDLDNKIILDKDFWWYIGIWLAEGWTQSRDFSKSIHTCHNLQLEKEYALKVRKLFLKYNRKVSFIEKKESNVIETVFNSSQLFKFINNEFGKGAKNKIIPEWVKRLPYKYKKELIKGYLNRDGSIYINNSDSKYNTSFVSISFELLESIQDILFSMNIISILNVLREESVHTFPDGKICNTQKTYSLNIRSEYTVELMDILDIDYCKSKINKRRRATRNNFFSNDYKYIYLRIKGIEKEDYKGKVYNFETEDHSYLCKYLTTHNCDVGKGTSKDYSSIQVMDIETYEQVAEYKGHIGTKMLGRLIRQVARYYNQGYVVIESNGIGEAVFNEVYYHDTDPYDNVYKQKISKNGITVMTGWNTNVKTRSLMIDNLIDWLTLNELWKTLTINSKRIYLEMTTWVWNNGRVDHQSGCVSGDTIITTKEGFKNIKDVNVGEYVLTHKNNWKKVSKTFKFKDDRKQMLKVKAWGNQYLNITSNQEMFLNNKNINEFRNFKNIYNFKEFKANSLFSKDILNKKEYDKEFLFFIGHVLADGTVTSKNNISITLAKSEEKILDLYLKYFKDEKIFLYDYKTYVRIRIKSERLWNILKDINKSENKQIPEEFMYISPEQQMYIFYGYIFGDGSFYAKKTGKVQANSISYKLIYYISSILFRNNITYNIRVDKPRLRKNKLAMKQYSIYILGKENEKLFKDPFIDNLFQHKNNYKEFKEFNFYYDVASTSKRRNFNKEYLQSSLASVEEINWNDFYYDLEVEDDHSYIANGYVVHNSHDDSLIALGLCIYLRNKASGYGESFFITEDGDFVEAGGSLEREEIDDGFGFALSEDEKVDTIQDKYGCSIDQYNWLLK